jgi:hypothetical protein
MIASRRTKTPSPICTQPDLHSMGEAWWIDHLDQVVIDESAAVVGLASTPAGIVLQKRQGAGEAGELD